MSAIDRYEKSARLVKAAEDWADIYRDDIESFAKVIKAEAKMQRQLIMYFKELGDERVDSYVDWYDYGRRLAEIQAADEVYVDVQIKEVADTEDALVMKFIFDSVSMAALAGVEAGEAQYLIALPDGGIPAAVDKAAKETIAELLGKTYRNGVYVDNPKAKYKISEVTRNQVRRSIRTSLELGETQAEASARLKSFIKDAKRAEKIASTEAVNAYQGGQYNYGVASGAVKKEWQSLAGACPLCVGNSNAGEIDIDAEFPSGHKVPSCHPWDRCGLRYIYQEELDSR